MYSFAARDYLNAYIIRLSGSLAAFRIHYWGFEIKHCDTAVHRHSFYEICYVLLGEGVYLEGEREYPLKPGTIFYSRPKRDHQIRSQDGLDLLFVAFELVESETGEEGISLFRQLSATNCIVTNDAGDSPSANIWRALMQHAASPSVLAEELIRQLAYNLLLSLQTLFCASDVPISELPPKFSGSQMLLNRAALLIRDNLEQPLHLKDVARYLHISAGHLSRLFIKLSNTSFTDYVKKERIRKASELLQSSNLSIKEIAANTGFSTVHYFTKVFSDEVAYTPAAYRKVTSNSNRC